MTESLLPTPGASHGETAPIPHAIHFIGIGGIGMLALAQHLISSGHVVSGSELQDSDTVAELRRIGAGVHIGHDAQNVAAAELVVVTSAVRDGNPELESARRRGTHVIKRAELLGRIANSGRSVAVSGTHGKSTTTAYAAHLLRAAGYDVTLFGGGFVRREDGSTEGPSWGTSTAKFVVEADEFDRSFHWLRPNVGVITGIDFDHPDIYADMADLESAFVRFGRQVSERLLVSAESEVARSVAVASGTAFETYGIGPGHDWSANDVEFTQEGARFSIAHLNAWVPSTIMIPGRHNVLNALAAVGAAAMFSGLKLDIIAGGLNSFRGVVRRLESHGTIGGVTVVDDYAHHPQEITAALEALRRGDHRLRVLFQPHTYTRTKALFHDFVDAFSAADEVVLLDVYAAREDPIDGVSSEYLAQALRSIGIRSSVMSKDDSVAYLAETATEGDTVITMGAGDVGSLASTIVRLLREAEAGRASTQRGSRTVAEPRHNAPLLQELRTAGLSRVAAGEPLGRYTSWRVGGPADYFAVAETAASLRRGLEIGRSMGKHCLVLGGGSNVLVADEGVEGLVILNRVKIFAVHDDVNPVEVEAGGGLFFARLARLSAQRGWTGLEWGIAIPGTIGAGVVNNAGAHGGDVALRLRRAEIVDAKNSVSVMTNSELGFRYRESIFKHTDGRPIIDSDDVVLRAWFTVDPDVDGVAEEHIDELVALRQATQPVSEPSAGSTFKNPAGDSAGKLLEDAGLKGRRVGDAEISNTHANFIINRGHATSSSIAALIRLARGIVAERSGITLEPEVQVVGRWHEDTPLMPGVAEAVAS